MNKTSFRNFAASSDDDDELEAKNMHLPYAESQMTVSHIRVHIDEAFKEPKYYRAVVDRLANLTVNDQVTFYLNSKGGHLDGLIALLHAVKYTEASVMCVVVGEVLSAGSFFALSCPNVQISDNATMMVHHAQFGSAGKASDVQAHTQFTLKFCEDLFRSTYKGFLTPAEIDQCIGGKEFWFDSKEIIRRLELREKLKNKSEGSRSKRKPKANSPDTTPIVFPEIPVD